MPVRVPANNAGNILSVICPCCGAVYVSIIKYICIIINNAVCLMCFLFCNMRFVSCRVQVYERE